MKPYTTLGQLRKAMTKNLKTINVRRNVLTITEKVHIPNLNPERGHKIPSVFLSTLLMNFITQYFFWWSNGPPYHLTFQGIADLTKLQCPGLGG